MALLRDQDATSAAQQNGNGGGGALLLVGAAAIAGYAAYEWWFKGQPAATPTYSTPPATLPTPPAQCSDTTAPPSYWSQLDPPGKLTTACFCIMLGRQPALTDIGFWETYYVSGHGGYSGIAAVGIGIINDSSEEYRNNQDAWANYLCQTQVDCSTGANYPLAWITGLYINLLGRAPQAQESAYWLPIFASQGRIQVASDFVNGSEFATRVQAQVKTWGG